MKRLFSILAILAIMAVGNTTLTAANTSEVFTEAAVNFVQDDASASAEGSEVSEEGFHQELKSVSLKVDLGLWVLFFFVLFLD